MKEATARVVSSLVLAPLALAAVWQGGIWLLALLAAALAVLAGEWRRLVQPPGGGVGLAAVLAAALALAFFDLAAGALAVLGLGAAATAILARRCGGAVWPAAFGPLYLGAPAVAILWLRAAPDDGLILATGLLVLVWTTDIGAYAVGRTFGGAKLAPRISPGKTWAGAIGGATLAGAVGAALAPAGGRAPLVGALAGIAISVVAQAGDLFESWLKRRRGVKDSGRSVPGHGGLLDRVDGLIGAAPAVAVLVALDGG